MSRMSPTHLVEQVEQRILLIRGQKVMLDSDLAELYGAKTEVLNQAVKRNLDRFPRDFMFQLTQEEAKILRSQIVISKKGRGDPSEVGPAVRRAGGESGGSRPTDPISL